MDWSNSDSAAAQSALAIIDSPSWQDVYKMYNEAWNQDGGEIKIYGPLLKLINVLVHEIYEQNRLNPGHFPGIQPGGPLFKAHNTHDCTIVGSPASQKPDLTLVDVNLPLVTKESRSSKAKSSKVSYHYQKTMGFIEVKKSDETYKNTPKNLSKPWHFHIMGSLR